VNRTTLVQRLRQLQALDPNAAAVYTDLAIHLTDKEGQRLFAAMAQDEMRHTRIVRELLELLGDVGPAVESAPT
jgi:rubrerythrin